jgi:hypothetical protein
MNRSNSIKWQGGLAIVWAAFAVSLSGACALDVDDSSSEPDVTGDPAALAAANAATLAHPVGSGPYCAIVLDKIRPGQVESRVVSNTCAETKEALAGVQAASSSDVLLMEWWLNINFGGTGAAIMGHEGPCDGAGYGIRDVGFAWRNLISSFKSFSNCNYVVGYTGINYGGASKTFYDRNGINRIPATSVPWVGDLFNDVMDSFRVSRL